MWYVTIAVLLAETTFYLIFASGEEQSWNKKVIVEKGYKSKSGVKTTFGRHNAPPPPQVPMSQYAQGRLYLHVLEPFKNPCLQSTLYQLLAYCRMGPLKLLNDPR